MVQEIYTQFGIQLITLVIMVFSLPLINLAYYRKNIKPPFHEQMLAAFVTAIGAVIGAVLAHLNGLGGYVNFAIYALMGVYFLALLTMFGQLNPVLAPLVKKVIKILDKNGDGTIDVLDPKDTEEK